MERSPEGSGGRSSTVEQWQHFLLTRPAEKAIKRLSQLVRAAGIWPTPRHKSLHLRRYYHS